MQLKEEGSSNLNLTLTTNIPAASQQRLYVFVQTGQSIDMATSVGCSNGIGHIMIDKNKLGEGISRITIFNGELQPVCERLYFKPPENWLSISCNADASTYGTRKKVNLSVAAKGITNRTIPANLSLSVYRIDSLVYENQEDILSYLCLSSDLKGYIESPGYYFSARGPEVSEAIENLVLTHGWRRFSWDNILNPVKPEFMPEYDGHIVSGKITRNQGQPVEDVRSFLSVPGTQLQFYTCFTDTSVMIHYDVRDYYGQNNIVVQAGESLVNDYHIEIFNPFAEVYSESKLPAFMMPPDYSDLLNEHSLHMQVQNAYAGELLRKFASPDIDSMPFFGIHCNTYMLDDYVRFSTVEEILREYVPEVAIRRSGGQLHLYNINPVFKELYSNDPLILLDGVPVSSQKILSYDPLKIKKLQVLDLTYINGLFAFYGVASFTTYNGNMEELQLDPRSVIVDYEGLQFQREFYSPAYATEQQVSSRVPDFRNVLFWSPEINTDSAGNANITFYTSDIRGKYVAVIQGLNANGLAGSQSVKFEVR